jgi:hypothetical protein
MSFVHRITSGLAGASLTGMGKAGSTQQTRKSLFEVNEGTATALALAAPRDICGPATVAPITADAPCHPAGRM